MTINANAPACGRGVVGDGAKLNARSLPQPAQKANRSDSVSTANRKRRFPLPIRRKDIARVVVRKHGRLPPYHFATYIKIAAWHCPYGPNRREALLQWFEWVCAPPQIRRQVDAILKQFQPRNVKADTLCKMLHLSDAQRTAWRVYTIGSYDVSREQRIERRKEKRRVSEQAKRRANGAKPREQSISRTKPWEAFGIKRRAWEQRGKPAPVTAQIRGHDTVLTPGLESASRDTARGSVG
jgi:hypothetical protein